MAGNIEILQSASAGASVSTGRTTLGVDTNKRPYATDVDGIVLYAGYTQTVVTNNSTGSPTITFAPNANQLNSIVNVSGSASTRVLVLDVANRLVNDTVTMRINTGTTAGIVIDVMNATTGGTSLIGGTFTTDGTGNDNLALVARFDGTAWQTVSIAYPTL